MLRVARWRARRQLRDMTPDQSALLLRCVIQFEVPCDPEIVALIADRAATAAEGPGKAILQKVAEAYRAGRQIKFGTYPAEFRTVMVPRALEKEIESAFKEMKSDA